MKNFNLSDDFLPVSAVLDIFKQINAVPRPSWHEEKIADFLCNFARQHNLQFKRDEHNCVVISKPATPGYESGEPIVLLNHSDMVCVAEPGVNFNPLADGIQSYEDNGWLKAKGTSLGADNGIGLSMALAVLASDKLVHGPLEVLCTTNEEDGMTGAANLSPDFIKGRKVINLDSEAYNTITVGAAGAYLQFFHLPYSQSPAPNEYTGFELKIAGGLGGHSGVDIHLGRSNAIVLMAQLLNEIYKVSLVQVSEFYGGEANPAIPTSAGAKIAVPANEIERVKQTVSAFSQKVKTLYALTDPNLAVSINPSSVKQCIAGDVVRNLVEQLCALPCGVIEMRDADKGVVQTSNNIGVLRQENNEFFISTHTRSFDQKEMEKVGQSICSALTQIGAKSELIMSVPAWQEDENSAFLEKVNDSFKQVLGFEPEKVSMHFVLEAGFYTQIYPGIQIASIGPRILQPHSTSERVEISTVEDIWMVLQYLLRQLFDK